MIFFSRKKGASLTEFGLLIGLIAILLIGSLGAVGDRLQEIFGGTEGVLNNVTAGQHVPNIGVTGPTSFSEQGAQSILVTVTDEDGVEGMSLSATSSDPSVSTVTVSGEDGSYRVSFILSFATNGDTADLSLVATDVTGRTARKTVALTLPVAQSCYDLFVAGVTEDGAYQLDIDGAGTDFTTETYYCDMTTNGGGWTIFQQRDSDTDFYQNWASYKNGFGTYPNFWLGNDRLSQLTKGGVQLYVGMTDPVEGDIYQQYSTFFIGDESTSYQLMLSGTSSGSAGDGLSYHSGSMFSTYDVDNDGNATTNCAVAHVGAWWYNSCHRSNLNGDMGNTDYGDGTNWNPNHLETLFHRSMIKTKMMVR